MQAGRHKTTCAFLVLMKNDLMMQGWSTDWIHFLHISIKYLNHNFSVNNFLKKLVTHIFYLYLFLSHSTIYFYFLTFYILLFTFCFFLPFLPIFRTNNFTAGCVLQFTTDTNMSFWQKHQKRRRPEKPEAEHRKMYNVINLSIVFCTQTLF